MQYAPRKIFILENGQYIEIDYQRFELMMNQQSEKNKRYFIPLHGMLMEVDEQQYYDFYKDRRRQKYLKEESLKNGEISYDMLTTNEFIGEEILVDEEMDVEKQVERRLINDELYHAITLLSKEEQDLIHAIFFEGSSEREYAKKQGVYSNAIHYRKNKIIKKLKELLEKNKK